MVKRGAGRPFPTHTKLGRLLADRGLRAVDVTKNANVYPRMLTDLLAGRKPPTSRTLMALSEYLRVPPEAILEDTYPLTRSDRPVGSGRCGVTSAPAR